MKSENGTRKGLIGQRRKQVLATRHKIVLVSACLLLPVISLIVLNLSRHNFAHGASNGDYRSIASGNWSNVAIWEKYASGAWGIAPSAPTDGDKEITIQAGHTVAVNVPVSADQLIVAAGGILSVDPGITLTIAAGTGTDLTVTGTMRNAGTVTKAGSATISFASGGKYEHTHTTTAGVIPTATWNAASTCEFTGYTTNNTAPTGLNQSFGNVTWNCTAQTQDINLNGSTTTINGNFTVTSTGTNVLFLSNATYTVNISGNYNQTGGTVSLTANGTAVIAMNIFGNWTHTGGTLTTTTGSTSTVLFRKSGSQIFTASGNTVGNDINFAVNSGSTLVMGTSALTGKNFTLNSGATLSVGSPDGIAATGSTGNIQVTGTRTFNAGANYIFAGTSGQITGNGFPATVNNLQINNSSDVTLSSSISVAGTLTFTSGCFIPGSSTLAVTNTSASSVTGHSASSYVKGSLRRSVSSLGTYPFPVGSASNYELATVQLIFTSGVSTITCTFINENPIVPAYPLTGILLNNLDIVSMLDHGYWNITPNSPLTGGTYKVTLKERGYSPVLGGKEFWVLKRNNSSSPWQSAGVHNLSTQNETGGTVTAECSGLNSFSDFAISYGKFMSFKNPELISGTDGAVDAIYKFPDVTTGIDAWVQILQLSNSTLDDVDNTTEGYNDAWQPFLNIQSNSDGSILWRIVFKKEDTATDTVLQTLSMTSVDVDGSSSLIEYTVTSSTGLYSYALDPSTVLTVSHVPIGYHTISSNSTISNIDTSHHEAMMQMNFQDVDTIIYRTGVITTDDDDVVRQFCVFFRWFMSGNIALPIQLVQFTATRVNTGVDLAWATATEKNNDYFTVERSKDGSNFEPISTIKGAGNSTTLRTYKVTDKKPFHGENYYRIKQTDFDGKSSYSPIRVVDFNDTKATSTFEIKSVNPKIFTDNFNIQYECKSEGPVRLMIQSVNGRLMHEEIIIAQKGTNFFNWTDRNNLPKGIYFVVLVSGNEKSTAKVIKQ